LSLAGAVAVGWSSVAVDISRSFLLPSEEKVARG
jgi:hypothetical protein